MPDIETRIGERITVGFNYWNHAMTVEIAARNATGAWLRRHLKSWLMQVDARELGDVIDDRAANLSDIARELRLLVASFDDNACGARQIARIVCQIAQLSPSRLRLAAAMHKLRTHCEQMPSACQIVYAVATVEDAEIAHVAALRSAWQGRGAEM